MKQKFAVGQAETVTPNVDNTEIQAIKLYYCLLKEIFTGNGIMP